MLGAIGCMDVVNLSKNRHEVCFIFEVSHKGNSSSITMMIKKDVRDDNVL